MKKFLIFLPFFLFALKPLDFSICYKKYSYINNLIPVTKNKSVTFSKLKRYLYFDPFTNLYVIYSKNKHYIHFYKNPKLGWWMAGIKNNSVFAGSFAKEGYFLNFSHLSVKTEKNSVISDLFCRAYGISSGYGFLDTKRLLHFAKYGYWGDAGFEVDRKMKVIYSDPFYTRIKPGEKILMINNKKATPEIFTDYVLLGKVGDILVIKTDKHLERVKIRKKTYLFTPLNYYGIKIDKNLYVTLPEWIEKKYLIKRAKLIKINGKKINSFNDMLYLLSFDKNVTITVENNGIIFNISLRK